MRIQVTNEQLLSAMKLLKNLKKFVDTKMGSIDDLQILQNPMLPNTIIIKYEKKYSMAGSPSTEFKIGTIDKMGEIQFIDNKFKDIFERAAFLSECRALDIQDEKQYEKID